MLVGRCALPCPVASYLIVPQYFVTMDIEAADPLLPVDQLARVMRESILPSVEALMQLAVQGKVITGGYPIGDRFMVFIVEAESEDEVREVLAGLPLSDVARTTVRRLQSPEELRDSDGYSS